MAKALKLMTWNVQMLPDLFQASDLDIRERARRIARAILDLPAREQPDIVAFNEVFNEDGRRWLLRYLRSAYPHFIEKLEHPGVDFEQDSGLMLFSKTPFQALPTGGTHFFEVFQQGAGMDALASKGVGIVRVAGPFDPTTIAFTHLQASYDAANTDNMDVRRDQFRQVRESLLKVADNDLQHYANGVVVGDLNVKGDPDDTSGEWNQVFSAAPDTFGADFDDGWRASMHAPNDATDYDAGYTQRDTKSLVPNRYDYQCARRNANVDIGLVAHHLFTPIRPASEVTDHWALLGHLHRINDNCSPSAAVALLASPPSALNPGGSPVWLRAANFRDEDMYHWVYVGDSGTYSAWCLPQLEVAAFRRSDFTNELQPVDILSVSELPPTVQSALGPPAAQTPFTRGSVFASREPFFLRFRGVSPSFQGTSGYAIIRHRGDSPATAIVLHPHLAVDPGLPAGQKLGLTDECFFRADRPSRFSEQSYDDRFVLSNPARVPVAVELHDTAQTPLDSVSGNGPELKIVRHGSAERVYLVLRRTNVADTNFQMTWASPLTYLALDESLRLHVDDETGPDWPGADELDLSVEIDGVNVFAGSWDDADSNEDWPGLASSVQASVAAKRKEAVKNVPFTDSILFEVLKTDGLAAHGSAGGAITALGPQDRDQETRVAAITISDPFGDGHLTARATLSKYPLL
jgi:exonuclease III